MCYNKKCKIKIKTFIDGIESDLVTNGTVTKSSSSIRFDYILDGDECTFALENHEAVQTRRGEQNVQIVFRKGEQTECAFGSCGLTGDVAIYTEKIRLIEVGNDASLISLVYTLGGQKIRLDFWAKYNAKVKI